MTVCSERPERLELAILMLPATTITGMIF